MTTPMPTATSGIPVTATPAVPAGIPPGAQEGRAVDVYDGDTIMVEIDDEVVTVRLLGIDTPETRQPDGPGECYGPEASDYVRRLLLDRTVWLERDVTDRDSEDGLPRYIWVVGHEDSEAYSVNEHLIRRGYAVVNPRPPDLAYAERFAQVQEAAITAQAGLWAVCGGADTPLEPTAAPPEPDPPIADCAAFVSYEEANAYYASRPDAQPFLDPNFDGRACEVWFGVF